MKYNIIPTVATVVLAGDYPANPEATAQAAADGVVSFSGTKRNITAMRHPDYECKLTAWELFRDAWIGGDKFVDKYVDSFSVRETPEDLTKRKKASYCVAVSKGCVKRVKNAIFQRMAEVKRTGGPKDYLEACNGDKYGVDRLGSSMNTFIGREVLPELLALEKIGVYIDKAPITDTSTLADTYDKRPYLYTYKAEDILAWTNDDSSEPNEFNSIFLRENYLDIDEETGLPIGWSTRYRHCRLMTVVDDNGTPTKRVRCRFYDKNGVQIGLPGAQAQDYWINIPVIPFVVFQLSESLLTDIAKYQVALTNLSSSDLSYALKMNFPFYTEQFDMLSEAGPLKTSIVPDNREVRDTAVVSNPQNNTKSQVAKEEIAVGVSTGRRYAKGLERPGFINPSEKPLEVSMKKQDMMKDEVEEILSLTLSNITAGSVDIQSQDLRQGLESGLNNIGMELEYGERKIAAIWPLYQNSKEVATVSYPNTYSIKTDEERRKEAKEINELKSKIPSPTYQRETAKLSVIALFQGKLPQQKITTMFNEIDEAKTMTSDAEEIAKDLENGLVSTDTASMARGYPKGETEQAKKDHAERIARIQAAQTADGMMKNAGSRGVPDLSGNATGDASLEKKASRTDASGTQDKTKVRGEGQ